MIPITAAVAAGLWETVFGFPRGVGGCRLRQPSMPRQAGGRGELGVWGKRGDDFPQAQDFLRLLDLPLAVSAL